MLAGREIVQFHVSLALDSMRNTCNFILCLFDFVGRYRVCVLVSSEVARIVSSSPDRCLTHSPCVSRLA